MTSVPSATTWGSPTASKRALLIHGLTSSSHTWHRVASTLATQGYFVTAPNLVGHWSRVSSDYRLSSIAQDLCPYLAAGDYSLIMGHSLGALAALALFVYLSPSRPTAIVLVDPPIQLTPESVQFFRHHFVNSCVNIKQAKTYCAENPLWTPEDGIFMELGRRLCAVDAVHGIFEQNTPWKFFDYLDATSEKWRVTLLIADPELFKVCSVEELEPYPFVRPVVVPGAGHWIQYEFPDVIVEEALKMIAELETA